MFFPVRSTDGAVLPFEQHPAAAGTYESGMMLTVSNGKLTKANEPATMPLYMCVSNATVADGDLITAAPVSQDVTYRCDIVEDEVATVGEIAGVRENSVCSGENAIFQITAVLEDGSVEGRFIK